MATGQAHDRLLDSYHAERAPVARTVLRTTDRGFMLETTANPVGVWARAHLAGRLIGPLTRVSAIRAMAFRLFAQTWISYRDNPAVGGRPGHRGGPRPGDRAPYGRLVRADPPIDLDDILDGPGHQLLLFEGRRPGPATAGVLPALRDLLDRYAIDIPIHVVPSDEADLHDRYGARSALLCLVRPDGHLAYLGPPTDLDRFAEFLDATYQPREPKAR